MMTVRDAVREDARRQHRTLAMFCALFCWHHEIKACFVEKELFLKFIGLERLKDVRFQWVEEDVQSYFPFVFRLRRQKKDLIVLSKISESELLESEVSKKKALYFSPSIFDLAEQYSPKSEILLGFEENKEKTESIENAFPYISSMTNPYEFSLLNTLSLLASGLIDPALALKKNN